MDCVYILYVIKGNPYHRRAGDQARLRAGLLLQVLHFNLSFFHIKMSKSDFRELKCQLVYKFDLACARFI